MQRTIFTLLLLLVPVMAVCQKQNVHAKPTRNAGLHFNPPLTPRIPVSDTYFGKKVIDHYRWLENLNDPKVKKWLKTQSTYAHKWLDKLSGRDSLLASFKLLDGMAPAEINSIQQKAGRYFFLKTLPHQKSAKLYYREEESGKDILLFDPRQNGSNDNITSYMPSENGKKVAFVLSHDGAEIGTIHIMNVDTKKIYPKKIGPTWNGVFDWTPDSKGFLYGLLNSRNTKSVSSLKNHKAMYHRLNTDPTKDKVIFSKNKYPDLGFSSTAFCHVYYSANHKYIFGIPQNVSHDKSIFYARAGDLLKPVIPWKRLARSKDHITNYAVHGDDIYLLTHDQASKYKIIKTSLKHPSLLHAQVVVPEGKNKITYLVRAKDYLFLTYSDGINSTAKKYNLHTGKLTPVELPLKGNATLTSYGSKTNDGLIYLTSWKQPLTMYDYNASNNQINVSGLHIETSYPDVDDIKVVETEARSYDGAMVPISIIYNKNVPLDGSANTILRGYGAYGSNPYLPYFRTTNLALLNRGIVLAFAHVRGSSVKGEAWYKAGYKTTKPNTWKDFIACAKYLIKNDFTSPQRLIGMGRSAGGITVGRAITARPDLFGAAIDNVGTTNTLRAETMPGGPANVAEYGTVKDSVESRALYEMDAFHHVKKGVKYPAVIAVGGINDPRVLPWQPAKFAAKLQYATASNKPVFLYIKYNSGHFTQDKLVTFKHDANIFSFALWQTAHPSFQLKKEAGLSSQVEYLRN